MGIVGMTWQRPRWFVGVSVVAVFVLLAVLATPVQAQTTGAQWEQTGGDIDGENSGDESGRSVAVSANGNRVAIGATVNGGNGNNSGHVRVFERVGSGWVKVGADIDGENEFDNSGFSVAVSADGNRVAIGAPLNDLSLIHI